ncbi:MAG: replicative DNA helicase [Lachnospiraceae bacterium]|nr:replicative DNA helicase [Lachnospiraceae bacterium]
MDEALIKKIMPHSIEAEQAVIGSMLMDADAVEAALETLFPEDFYGRQYGTLFQAMMELNRENKPIDLVTLQDKLREDNVPEELAGMDFIRDILNAVPTSANVKYYAGIVKEKSLMRKLIRTTEEITADCYKGTETVEYLMDTTEKKIFQLMQSRGGGDFVPIRQVVINALERIEAASKQNGSITGVSTGFIDLDYQTSGMQPSDLILIAARPSMGKTAFVLNMAQHMAFRDNVTTAIFSLEMSKEQLVNRLFSLESKVDAQVLRNGRLEDSDWERLIESAEIIGNSNLIIDDTPSISITELRSKCRKYKMEMNLGVIIIDYLQLMSGSGGKSSVSRQQEVSDISRSLKALARELNVPVIALSQLSRAVEQRDDKRPMLSDLRESGAIEQDADVVMFIYRDDYYNKESEKKNIAEIIVAKQRNGPVGTVELAWRPQYTQFGNLSK